MELGNNNSRSEKWEGDRIFSFDIPVELNGPEKIEYPCINHALIFSTAMHKINQI